MHDVDVDRSAARGESAERRRREGPLHESPEKVRELLELAPDAVVVANAEHRVTDVNEAACKLYGYRRDELLGMSFADLGVGDDDLERISRELPAVPGLVHVGEWRVKRRDGALVPIEATTKILSDGSSMAFIRDITERKRMEHEREEALQWMRAVFAQSPVGLILVHGPGHKHVEFNARAQEVLGQRETLEELRSTVSHLDGSPINPRELPSERALRGERTDRAELLQQSPSGKATPLAATAAPITCPDGTSLGAIVAFEDITAEKELERLRTEWSAVVSHDLRQPLASISLNAQLLGRTNDRGKLLKYAERIQSAALRLGRMVGDLTDLSRLEASRLELVRQPVDIPAIVGASIERISLTAPERSIELQVQGRGRDAHADPDRIAQVMDNLLTNAAKYSHPGTPIAASVSWERDTVAVAVTSEGRPLTNGEIAHIFERFHRTESAKLEGIEGVGLGLYITRSLVEAHGGHITALSTPAGQTTFRFTLPTAGR